MALGGSKRRANGGSGRPDRAAPLVGTHVGNGELAFTFFSNADHHDVQKKILAAVTEHGFAGESFFAIRLALEEAIINAVKHGNRMDPSKKVHVEATVSDARAEITIEDEGPGFDRASVPDPTADENLHKCSGRGILLIESYMSEVSWDRGGRRLRMIRVK